MRPKFRREKPRLIRSRFRSSFRIVIGPLKCAIPGSLPVSDESVEKKILIVGIGDHNVKSCRAAPPENSSCRRGPDEFLLIDEDLLPIDLSWRPEPWYLLPASPNPCRPWYGRRSGPRWDAALRSAPGAPPRDPWRAPTRSPAAC